MQAKNQPFQYWLFILMAFMPLAACQKNELPPASPQWPNVLLISVDDLNGMLGCYGDSLAKTPHIDALASRSTLFQNAYCQQALCNPSRASMLTGRRPSSLGVMNLSSRIHDGHPKIKTLPQLFRENGYYTARAGKIFHMGVPDGVALPRHNEDEANAWDTLFNCHGYELNSNGVFKNLTPWETHRVGTGGAISWLRAEKGDELQHDHRVASAIIRLMEAHKEKPFFLAAGFIRPHVPLVAPKRFFEPFDSMEIPLPKGLPDDRQDMPEPAYNTWAADFNISEEGRREAIKAYKACVSFVDEQVGRLLQALEENELAENTIVVFVSDHGYQLGEHGLWFKNFLFRESVLSPLIIYDPRQKEGGVVEQVVELLDIFPTLVEACSLAKPEGLEGQSLLPLMAGDTNNWKDYAIVETQRAGKPFAGLYTRQWAYMDWGEYGEELYSLKNDPEQLHNLATLTEYQAIKDKLQKKLNDQKPVQ